MILAMTFRSGIWTSAMVASLASGCGQGVFGTHEVFYYGGSSSSSSNASWMNDDPTEKPTFDASVGDDFPPPYQMDLPPIPPPPGGGPPRNVDLDCSENLIGDPGFEQPLPNANWTETTQVFPSILCDASCSPTDGAGPHSGNGWAWFGGHEEMETAALTQFVTLDGTLATLSFFVSVNRASVRRNGAFAIYLDGTQLFSVGDFAVTDYEFLELDISDFADGRLHVLRFEAVFEGTAITNFFVDDVLLQTCTPKRPTDGEGTGGESGTGNESGTDSATATGDASSTTQ